jgi:cytidyltransferase-like protein
LNDILKEKGEHFIKRVLGFIFSRSLQDRCRKEDILEAFNLSDFEADSVLSELKEKGLIKTNRDIVLTPEGRKKITVVLTGGVFDIIHRGHIYTLSKAKALGDVLVVVVARDRIVEKLRGKSAMNSERDRAELVNSIKYVDAALLGSEEDPLGAMYVVKPDIIAIGYDQKHDEREIETKALERGLKVRVKRLDSPIPDMKSTKIKKERDAIESF